MLIGFESSSKDKTKVVNRYVCSTCHGTGLVACSKCGGKGERKCPHCDGTGHACPVCTKGYVKKDRWINCRHCHGKGYWIDDYNGKRHSCDHCDGRGQIKETYKELCPSCHGDYKTTDHVCDRCGGKKKISCTKHEGCPSCGGKGKWSEVHDKASKCNLRLFRAFSMAFGFSGLQYLYVGRWCLFLLQFATFALLVTVALLDPDPNGMIATCAIRFCEIGSDAESVKQQIELFLGISIVFLGLLLVLNLLIGMFTIKRDRQGGLLSHDFKKGWFLAFFLLFGITGAHLAYMCKSLKTMVTAIVVHCIVVFGLCFIPLVQLIAAIVQVNFGLIAIFLPVEYAIWGIVAFLFRRGIEE